jgi:F-type H+-transporting ATPase subunit gamma
MTNLKTLRTRIDGIKSTQKITRAMRMVAAAKLVKSKKQLSDSTEYCQEVENLTMRLLAHQKDSFTNNQLICNTGKEQGNLLVIFTSDRGLCASFNMNVIKAAQIRITELQKQNKKIKLYLIGNKASDYFEKHYGDYVIGSECDISKGKISYNCAYEISSKILRFFLHNEFHLCEVFYNHFVSTINQEVFHQSIIPIENAVKEANTQQEEYIEYEPSENIMIDHLLPRYFAAKFFKILLNSLTGEFAARMTSMENATNNTESLIKDLTLTYNRSRQAIITKELIEIISGAEAINQ